MKTVQRKYLHSETIIKWFCRNENYVRTVLWKLSLSEGFGHKLMGAAWQTRLVAKFLRTREFIH